MHRSLMDGNSPQHPHMSSVQHLGWFLYTIHRGLYYPLMTYCNKPMVRIPMNQVSIMECHKSWNNASHMCLVFSCRVFSFKTWHLKKGWLPCGLFGTDPYCSWWTPDLPNCCWLMHPQTSTWCLRTFLLTVTYIMSQRKSYTQTFPRYCLVLW